MTSIAIDLLDGLSSAAAYKGPCRVATTANIALTGLQTVDGIALAAGDRVLVKDQTLAEENGIWVADTGPWRRAKDFNRTRDVVTGTQVLVTTGTVNEGRIYRVSTASVIFVGTTEIDFEYVVPPLADLGMSAAGLAIVQALSYADMRVLLAAPKTVSTIAALKASIPASEPVVFVNGAGRSHTMFEWRAGDYTALHAIDTVGVAFVKANTIASSAGSYVLIAAHISPRDAGAVGNDSTNDYVALNAWWAVLMASKYKGLIDGQFRSATALSFDCAARATHGFVIEGTSFFDSFIAVSDTTISPAFKIFASGGAPVFFPRLDGFGIRTNRAGVGSQIGDDDLVAGDAWNQAYIRLIFTNSSTDTSAVAFRGNHILGSFFQVIANCASSGDPLKPSSPGHGTAIQARQMKGNFGRIDGGNSHVAFEFLDGYNDANAFTGSNYEECHTAIKVSSGTCQNNRFIGGYMVAVTQVDSVVGSNNVMSGVDFSAYSGGSIGTNLVGWSFENEANSVCEWKGPTGRSISTSGSPVSPTAHMHLHTGASGNTKLRFETNANLCDFDHLTGGSLSITNYTSSAGFFLNAASAGGFYTFQVNSAAIVSIDSTGAVVSGKLVSNSATGGIGYATGAGGTQTQATNKATGVTLNKATGQITMNNAALAADTTVSFVLTNSAIAAGDLLILNHVATGTFGAYSLNARTPSGGSATIDVRNITAGSLSEAIVIGFAVIKSVTA